TARVVERETELLRRHLDRDREAAVEVDPVDLADVETGVVQRPAVRIEHGWTAGEARTLAREPGLLLRFGTAPPVDPAVLGDAELARLRDRAEDQTGGLIGVQDRVHVLRVRVRDHPVL